jgi:hypothetical protein
MIDDVVELTRIETGKATVTCGAGICGSCGFFLHP